MLNIKSLVALNMRQVVFRATAPAPPAASVPMLITGIPGLCTSTQYVAQGGVLVQPFLNVYYNNILYTLSASQDKILGFFGSKLIATRFIRGFDVNQRIVAIDFRPSNQQLYVLGNGALGAQLYIADLTSSICDIALTPVAGIIQTGGGDVIQLTSRVSMDFNPVTDLLRIVTIDGQNILVNADTGIGVIENNLVYPDGSTPSIAAIAHSNNIASAVNTTLYGIDLQRHTLVRIAGNTGVTTSLGSLGFSFTDVQGFDLQEQDPFAPTAEDLNIRAFLVVRHVTGSYFINLVNGDAAVSGVPLGRGLSVRDVAFSVIRFDVDITKIQVTLYVNGNAVQIFESNVPYNACRGLRLQPGDVVSATVTMSDGTPVPSITITELRMMLT